MRRVDDRRLVAVAIAAIAGGCAARPQPHVWISNGGTGPRRAECSEPSLRIGPERVSVLDLGAPGCGADETILASDVGAAYAFVQTATAAAPTGPIVSDPVALGVIGLASGGDERGLSAGAGERGLAAGAGERGLAAGAGERGLAAGADERGLAVGAGERGLAAGAGERGLAAGADERGLDAGARERAPWSLRKRVSPETAADGGAVEFTLTFVNDRGGRIERLVIVDRVDARLRVTRAEGARAFALPDRSTLLVWETHTPLDARGRRSVTFEAVVDLARGGSP